MGVNNNFPFWAAVPRVNATNLDPTSSLSPAASIAAQIESLFRNSQAKSPPEFLVMYGQQFSALCQQLEFQIHPPEDPSSILSIFDNSTNEGVASVGRAILDEWIKEPSTLDIAFSKYQENPASFRSAFDDVIVQISQIT